MNELIAKGTWVEVHNVVLQAGQRVPHLPGDTRQVPLQMRVKGFLVVPAVIGERVEIETATGRRLHGVLSEVNPAYTHSFGFPIHELSTIGKEVRTLLREKGRRQ